MNRTGVRCPAPPPAIIFHKNMGVSWNRLAMYRKVENCGLTALKVKTIIANYNFAVEDYALAA